MKQKKEWALAGFFVALAIVLTLVASGCAELKAAAMAPAPETARAVIHTEKGTTAVVCRDVAGVQHCDVRTYPRGK
jgi:hypothetical protein